MASILSEKSYQETIIEEELKSYSNRIVVKRRRKNLFQSIHQKIRDYARVFMETSSIHGLGHIVARGRHPLEVFLWLILVGLSVFGSVYLSKTTWLRYQYSPTVVSMDRDMFAWNTTFPAVTICPEKRIDEKKLKQYLENKAPEEKEALQQFIFAIANATFETFNSTPVYDGIPPEDYVELLVNLSVPFTPTLTIGASGVRLVIEQTLTEMGICYAINSKVAQYNSPAYRAAKRWDLENMDNRSFFVHPLDGEVFAQVINMSTSYDVYLHDPLEVPDIATKKRHSDEGYYMRLYVTALSVYTAPEAAKLKVEQRRCRFPHENNLPHNPYYSYTTCRMECRIRLCLKYCKCLPHFYRNIGKEKICDVRGLHCLGVYEEELRSLRNQTGHRIDCGCLPLCDDVNYVMQPSAVQKWFLGTNFQWGIVTYPRLRYRRDIIFGFTDVLVAVGGMAGLFLGCSVLSFMEIVYFLTLRKFWYIYNLVRGIKNV